MAFLSQQLGGAIMLGLGIWVTTQDTEYKHLAGNLVSLFWFLFLKKSKVRECGGQKGGSADSLLLAYKEEDWAQHFCQGGKGGGGLSRLLPYNYN